MGLETDYQKDYEKFKAESTNKPACEHLDMLREFLVVMDQTKNTYWRRYCIRDYWCYGTQHRDNIDKIKERVAPIERSLIRKCEVEINTQQMRQTLFGGAEQKTTASGGTATATSSPTMISGSTVVVQPHLHMPKPTV